MAVTRNRVWRDKCGSDGVELDLALPSDDELDRLVDDIDRRGYGCLTGYIPAASLAKMRCFVSSAIQRSSGEYVGFTGAAAVAGSTLDAIAASHEFQSLMKCIYERGTGQEAPPVEFHQVLRCLSGRTARRHSLHFHYDSYVVTALIPVEIPTTGRTGDLLMLPNTRKIRRSYAANLLDKLMLDNPASQSALKILMALRLLPLVRIRPVPGHIYFFWGYRSIHTNEACDRDKVRATALFHYADPHAGDELQRRLRRRA